MTVRQTTGRKPNAKSLANLRKGGGRAAGVPNVVSREVKALARNLFDDVYWLGIKAKIAGGKLNPMIEAKLLAYAYGEPKQQHELSGPDGAPIRQIIHQYVTADHAKP